MEELLQRFVDGTLGRDETRLYDTHCAHFCHRARTLDPSFFPGREKSKDGARSLANGAYASFSKEPQHEGAPAFVCAVRKAYRPATGFLYYWRDSAAIRFLRSEGSDLLRARANIQRNVRIHLRESFLALPGGAGRPSQARWALPEWPDSFATKRGTEVEKLHVSFTERGTKKLIRAVLEAAGAPLTSAEISAVIERAHQFAREEPATEEPAQDRRDVFDMISTGTLEKRIDQFWGSLDDDERRLLLIRGYADGGVAKVSFREVAEKLGRLGGESYRLKERQIFERLRDSFIAEEMDIVVAQLVSRLAGLAGTEPR